jgi:hypothetical protein
LTQATVLIDLAGALTVGAISVCWMQRVGGSVLQRQLRDVAVQNREPLFIEKDAERKPPQSIHLAFLRARPRSQVPDRHRQCLKGLRAFSAEEMELFVFVGAPDFGTHGTSSLTVGNRGHIAARQQRDYRRWSGHHE